MPKENLFTDGSMSLASKTECTGDLVQDIRRAVDAIGGFQRLVEAGDTILLKPNLNTADEPPGSSDPLFVKAIIKLLYEYGAGSVIVGDSSMFRLSTRQTLYQTGMFAAVQDAGAEVVCFEEGEWVPVETDGRYLRRVWIAKPVLDAAKTVYVPCIKTHFLADFSISLKLLMGTVRPQDRIKMHLHRLREKLADLNLVTGPDLIIADGRRCFISGGPQTGEMREPNLVFASADRIAIDVEGVRLIQSYPGSSLKLDAWSYPTIRRAVELGLGACDDASYRVVEVPSNGLGNTG